MIILEFRPDDNQILPGDKVLHNGEILTVDHYDSWFNKWEFKEKSIPPVDYDKNCRRIKDHIYLSELTLEQLKQQSPKSKFVILDKPSVGDEEEVYAVGPTTGQIYPCVVTGISEGEYQGYLKDDPIKDILRFTMVFKLVSDPDNLLFNKTPGNIT